MSLQSNDAHPRYWAYRNRSTALCIVPRRDWHKYGPNELTVIVDYKVPVLGTRGVTAMCEKFVCHRLTSTNPELAYQFYRQKLASYNARLDARHKRFIEQNPEYINALRQRAVQMTI